LDFNCLSVGLSSYIRLMLGVGDVVEYQWIVLCSQEQLMTIK